MFPRSAKARPELINRLDVAKATQSPQRVSLHGNGSMTRDVNRYTRNSINRDIANRSYIDLNFLGIAIIDIAFGISIYRDQCLRNSIIVV